MVRAETKTFGDCMRNALVLVQSGVRSGIFLVCREIAAPDSDACKHIAFRI